jgi:hypothetical protein
MTAFILWHTSFKIIILLKFVPFTRCITAISQVIYNVQITIHFTIFSGFWAHWNSSVEPSTLANQHQYTQVFLLYKITLYTSATCVNFQCAILNSNENNRLTFPFKIEVDVQFIQKVDRWSQCILCTIVWSSCAIVDHLFSMLVEKVLPYWKTTTLHTWITADQRKVSTMKFKERSVKDIAQYRIWIQHKDHLRHIAFLVSTHVRNFLCNRCLALPVLSKHIEAWQITIG